MRTDAWPMWVLGAASLLLGAGCSPGPSGTQLAAMAHDMADADNRRDGIAQLCEKDWGRAEPYLAWYAQCLAEDTDPGVRGVAARALAKSGAVKYLPVVAAALGDRSPAVRVDVAVALERLHGEAAVDPLCRAARDDGAPEVRAAAAKALRHYPQKKVAAALVYCMSDGSFEVRHWAHDSLVAMTGKDLGYEPNDWMPVAGADVPPHAPQWKRPWWDWFGTSKPQEPAAAAATQPAK